MAIISSTIITITNGKKCNWIENNGKPFYWCQHSQDFVLSRSQEGDEPITAGFKTRQTVFGADTYDELIAEIERLELIE